MVRVSHDHVTSHDCLLTSCEVSHSHVTFKVENLKAIKYRVRDTGERCDYAVLIQR